jgi:hypothetical protein
MNWTIVDSLVGVFQAATLIIAGLWAYSRFRNERTHYPHMEFGIDCHFHGPEGDSYMAEFCITINNKGVVRQGFHEIRLSVHGIDENDRRLTLWKESKPGYGESYDGRLYCPITLIKNVDIVPKLYKPYLVEPGCNETIRYITTIPSHIKYVLAHAEYLYERTLKPQGQPHRRPRTTERFMHVIA